MKNTMIEEFWKAVLKQDAEGIRRFFWEDAFVNWHCTNERFTAEEFIRANCAYPGEWDGEIKRVEKAGEVIVAVVRVFPKDCSASFHVVSFMRMEGEKIAALDEYWADDGPPPKWRQEMGIGRPIQ